MGKCYCKRASEVKDFLELGLSEKNDAFFKELGVKPSDVIALIRCKSAYLDRLNDFFEEFGCCKNLSDLKEVMQLDYLADDKFERICLKYYGAVEGKIWNSVGPLYWQIRNSIKTGDIKDEPILRIDMMDRRVRYLANFFSFFEDELAGALLSPRGSEEYHIYNEFYEKYSSELEEKIFAIAKRHLTPLQYDYFCLEVTNHDRKLEYANCENELVIAARKNLKKWYISNMVKRAILYF